MQEWLLTVAEAAELLEITERAVRKNAIAGKFGQVRYSEVVSRGGSGGKSLRIPLAGLPQQAQTQYIEKHGLGDAAEPVEASAYSMAADWQREEADRKLAKLRAYEAYIAQPGKKTDLGKQFVEVWKAANPGDKISLSNLYRWQADYREHGIDALVPDWGKNKGNHFSISPEALKEFYSLVLQPKELTVAQCYEILKLKADREGWNLSSLTTMQRIASQIPRPVWDACRKGKKAYINAHQTFTRRDPESISAGEIFVGDHQRMDFSILGPNGKPARPWLTAWMDMRSGKLVGWIVSFNPNSDTIVASFAEAALDPAIGLPRGIYIDNGRDYCNKRVAGRGFRGKKLSEEEKEALRQEGKLVDSLMERLGIIVHRGIPENARAKTIERVAFGNITGRFYKHMPTYCGSNPQSKPYDLDKKLKNLEKVFPITLEEISHLFSDWVRNVFNKTPSQKGKGREGECPDETFSRTRLPVRTSSEKALHYLFMKHPNPLKIGRNGVTLYGREYHAPELALLKGQTVQIRYRSEDMSRIWLVDKEERLICEATLIELTHAASATEEEFKRESKRKAAEWKAVQAHEGYQAAQQAEPVDVEEMIALYKQYGHKAPDPVRTSVVEMVALDANTMETARYIAATGTDSTRPEEISPWRQIAKK